MMRAPSAALRRISLTPLEAGPALRVLAAIDAADAMERDLEGHAERPDAEIVADWLAMRAAGGAAMVSWDHAPAGGAQPFAVLGAGLRRAGGVCDVGLIARDHRAFRLPLGRLAVLLRETLPIWAESRQVQRLEARCWAEHPRAPSLLRAIGFSLDCDLPAYGVGRSRFLQFAMLIGD